MAGLVRIKGFTLLELLVVLSIAAMLTALVRPMYAAAVPGARLKSDTLNLAVSLRESRNRAVSSGSNVGVLFDAVEVSYRVGDSKPRNFSTGTKLAAAGFGAESASDRVGRLDQYELVFFADGSSSGASLELQNHAKAYRIDVDWLTGRIKVAELENEQS